MKKESEFSKRDGIMKLVKYLVPATLIFVPAYVMASCEYNDGDNGYLYVWGLCGDSTCADDQGKRHWYISNVVYYEYGEKPYPFSVFFDSVRRTYGESINGSESTCYETRREAEAERLNDIADWESDFGKDTVRYVRIF